ncbi:squalene synthase HpnC [Hasllibacter halocynthiae]|uniref:Squalene synthase HpnC n=1 Tax=Hasllibacter halocynthiae TaxID=595589 RepID=A0A2T0X2B8_9RHOB|nr:squalene/phytoene synthase family protein [Hasllibacter halocynthiae]PRY93088.1 squalene synthase HpnC [Hasllibacter halocynthiae]
MTLADAPEEGGIGPAARRGPDPLVRAARAENFPVASRLLPRATRARVMAFYRFARTADDAADDPASAPSERLAALARLEEGLRAGQPANAGAELRAALAGTPGAAGAAAAALDLLPAFRRDAEGILCADWADLAGYCRFSAASVGRFLLAIHEEGEGARAPSDALCTALQVLNHLQDMGADRRRLGRRYLPGNWMEAEGARDADLLAPALTPALRRVVLRTLDAADDLLEEAAPLPARIRARGLRAQSTATLRLARRLSARLRVGDPLAGRVALSRVDFLRAGAAGLGAWA